MIDLLLWIVFTAAFSVLLFIDGGAIGALRPLNSMMLVGCVLFSVRDAARLATGNRILLRLPYERPEPPPSPAGCPPASNEEDDMATTVGKKGDMPKLIEDFASLERDAVAAYDAAIARLDSPEHKAKVAEFREDHVRHLEELEGLAAKHGGRFPLDPGAKSMLTTGKLKIADMIGGDGAILKAMATNEKDTVAAYSNGMTNDAVPAEDREVFQRAHADEERHKAWMEQAAQSA